MTSRQKTLLWRWVLSVVVISRLLFLIPEYLPNLLPENLVNQTWVSLQIQFDTESTNLVITHQFIDPLILGLITLMVGVMFLSSRDNTITAATIAAKLIAVLGILPLCLMLTYTMFYTMNAHAFINLLLSITNSLGLILRYVSTGAVAVMIMRFFILGIQKYFQDDRENERLKIKCEKEDLETTRQDEEISD